MGMLTIQQMERVKMTKLWPCAGAVSDFMHLYRHIGVPALEKNSVFAMKCFYLSSHFASGEKRKDNFFNHIVATLQL
jgi:hypothetical protein